MTRNVQVVSTDAVLLETVARAVSSLSDEDLERIKLNGFERKALQTVFAKLSPLVTGVEND